MTTFNKIPRSQATFLQFDADRYFTPQEFYLICTCLALQADPCESKPLIALQWMLAYWRADADDGTRHDRAEMFFYGRDGFGGEDWDTTLGELVNQMTDGFDSDDELEEPMISAENVNTLIKWAFDRFINWAPEPIKPKLPHPLALISMRETARIAITLSQFVDHFEEYETQALVGFLVEYSLSHPGLWGALAGGEASIDVQYGVGPTPDTRTLNINHGQWLVHYTEDADIAVEGPNEFSTKE